MKTIGLVQANYNLGGQFYLPYTIGGLQAFAESKREGMIKFLLPIFARDDILSVLPQLVFADAVAFSVYVWNEQYSLELARCLKQEDPSRIIMFGGPQIPDPFDEKKPYTPNRAEAYLKKYPFVDILIHGEGEVPFLAFLDSMECDSSWDKIPSASFFKNDTYVQTERSTRLVTLDDVVSPYTSGVFDLLLEKYPASSWSATLETNRGCPYRCTFCGWGSLVGQKIAQFPLMRVMDDITWIGEHNVEFIFVADANFGIFERDLEIAHHAVAVRAKYNYPHVFSIQSAKNVTDRVYDIHKALQVGGMEKVFILALQSNDAVTLEAIKRQNIKPQFYEELQRRARADGIPTSTDIILPLPGETLQSFINGVVNVIERGGSIQFNPLSIEPDAEMADPLYQNQYGIVTTSARAITLHGKVEEQEPNCVDNSCSPFKFTEQTIYEKQELVIGTKTMPTQDWLHAKIFSWMVRLLYFDRLLAIPLTLLHGVYKVSYQDMFRVLSESNTKEFPVFNDLRVLFEEQASAIVAGKDEFCSWDGVWWSPEEFAWIRMCEADNVTVFYDEAERLLEKLCRSEKDDTLLKSTIFLNRNALKIPHGVIEQVHITLPINVGEVYHGILEGNDVLVIYGDCEHVINKNEKWDLSQWSRDVVWRSHKGGRYLHEFE